MQNKRILYEDQDMIIYHKKSGVLVQSDRSFDVDVVSELKTYLVRKKEKPEVHVINRLDRPVEGLVLLAKNAKAAAGYSKILKDGEIGKDYLAVVEGDIGKALSEEESQGENPCTTVELVNGLNDEYLLTSYLYKDGKSNTSIPVTREELEGLKHGKKLTSYPMAQEKDIKKAMLTVKVIGVKDGMSLLAIHLLTGRHHQIRVQMSSLGYPLLGDTKYGAAKEKSKYEGALALCSVHLSILDKDFRITPENPIFQEFSLE